MKRSLSILVVGSVVAMAVACGGGGGGGYTTDPGGGNTTPGTGGTGSSGARTNAVTVRNNYFDPASDTVKAGTTVTWTWDTCGGGGYGGSDCVVHTVNFDDGVNSGQQSTGSFNRTFTTPGTYNYYCSVHGRNVMAGKVVVQ